MNICRNCEYYKVSYSAVVIHNVCSNKESNYYGPSPHPDKCDNYKYSKATEEEYR